MDIRDYASMVDAIGTPEAKEKAAAKQRIKPTIEVEYSDMVDFILAKKTKNTKKLLMVMPSKGKVCVSNGRTAQEATDEMISSFFSGNTDLRLAVPETVYMTEGSDSLKDRVNKIRCFIKSGCANILKYGVLTNIPKLSPRGYHSYNNLDADFLLSCENEMQFALRMMQREKLKMGSMKFYDFMRFMMKIKEICGTDIARYAIKSSIDSRIRVEYCGSLISEILNSKYRLNPRKLIEYLFYWLPEQGIMEIGTGYRSSLTEYRDYLSMEYSMYGEVRDKYPRYLKTQHDITMMKYQLVKDTLMEKQFTNAVKKYADLAYTNGKYTISIPEKPADLVEEGRRLCHCVVSYVNRVANENTMIVFCRMNSAVDDPYCTIEVCNGHVVQARCLQNAKPNDETLQFIESWAKKKKLEYEKAA